MRRYTQVIAAALAALVLASGAAGCMSEGPSASFGTPPKPGYVAGPGGAEAVGYVVREDIEGGFWALVDIEPSVSSTVQPKIIAVLLPGSVDEVGISALKGRFVWAAGRASGGASVRMSGPELLVDAIDPVETK